MLYEMLDTDTDERESLRPACPSTSWGCEGGGRKNWERVDRGSRSRCSEETMGGGSTVGSSSHTLTSGPSVTKKKIKNQKSKNQIKHQKSKNQIKHQKSKINND
jgi:hypothetical protein